MRYSVVKKTSRSGFSPVRGGLTRNTEGGREGTEAWIYQKNQTGKSLAAKQRDIPPGTFLFPLQFFEIQQLQLLHV